MANKVIVCYCLQWKDEVTHTARSRSALSPSTRLPCWTQGQLNDQSCCKKARTNLSGGSPLLFLGTVLKLISLFLAPTWPICHRAIRRGWSAKQGEPGAENPLSASRAVTSPTCTQSTVPEQGEWFWDNMQDQQSFSKITVRRQSQDWKVTSAYRVGSGRYKSIWSARAVTVQLTGGPAGGSQAGVVEGNICWGFCQLFTAALSAWQSGSQLNSYEGSELQVLTHNIRISIKKMILQSRKDLS